jgi:hypothetical protein
MLTAHFNHAHLTMASKLKLFSAVSLLLLVAAVSFVNCKGGKKSEETKSVDVKPSGQISHETLKLVRPSDLLPPHPGNTCMNFSLLGEWSYVYIHICSSWWH